MHYSLHLDWKDLGYWIVGLAALVMLAALVSGVVIHRKIFREFFTFRPGKHTQRSTLDLHNLTGVVALPFHFFFALSGLTIFAGIYLPVSETMLQAAGRSARSPRSASAKGLPFEPAGVPRRWLRWTPWWSRPSAAGPRAACPARSGYLYRQSRRRRATAT